MRISSNLPTSTPPISPNSSTFKPADVYVSITKYLEPVHLIILTCISQEPGTIKPEQVYLISKLSGSIYLIPKPSGTTQSNLVSLSIEPYLQTTCLRCTKAPSYGTILSNITTMLHSLHLFFKLWEITLRSPNHVEPLHTVTV